MVDSTSKNQTIKILEIILHLTHSSVVDFK